MNTFDISPFFRSTVGFERLFDQLGRSFDNDSAWPQYDVLKTGDEAYQITIAVPGFQLGDIDIEVRDSLLTVRGERHPEEERSEFLYRSIANRSFSRSFQLAEYVRVDNARLKDGLLTIALRREIPEAMQPRKIEVTSGDGSGPRRVEDASARSEAA